MNAETSRTTIDQFVLEELEHMLVPNPNRLDTTNRRQRIAAAVAYLNHYSDTRLVNVRAIAKLAGVSTATIYRLFDSEDALTLAGEKMTFNLYLTFLTRDEWHANPVFRLTHLFTRWVELWTLPTRQDQRSLLLYKRSARDQAYTILIHDYFKQVWKFWTFQFQRLHAEGYLAREPRFELIESLAGPLEARIFYPFMLAEQPPQLDRSWFEICWQATDEFMTLHGTPYFHQCKRRLNWDADLIAFQRNTD